MTLALLFAGAYLVGSIPFGVMAAKIKGVDLMSGGSGSAGATNVARLLGWRSSRAPARRSSRSQLRAPRKWRCTSAS